MAQLIEALDYKLGGRGFYSRFFIGLILPVALWPWIDPVSNRSEYQDVSWGVKAAHA